MSFCILCNCTVGASRNKTTPWEVNIFQRNECSLAKIQLPFIFDLCELLYVNQSELLARFCTDLIHHQYEIFGTKTHGDWGGGGGMREGCIRRIDWSKRAKSEGRRGMMSTYIYIDTNSKRLSVSFHTNLNTDFWPFPIHLFFWLIAPIYIHTELACKLNALQSH